MFYVILILSIHTLLMSIDDMIRWLVLALVWGWVCMSNSIVKWGVATFLILWTLLFSSQSFAVNVSKLKESVYRIVTTGVDVLDLKGTGSGFLVGDNNIIVTNQHVIAGASRFFVAFKSGKRVGSTPAEVIWRSEVLDLAILKTEADLPGRSLELVEYPSESEEKKLNSGDNVIAIGFPGDADNLIKKDDRTKSLIGIVSGRKEFLESSRVREYFISTFSRGSVQAIRRDNSPYLTSGKRIKHRDRMVVQHSADISGGNSGGPLFDNCGRIIGVNTFKPKKNVDIKLVKSREGIRLEGNVDSLDGVYYSVHVSELLSALRSENVDIKTSSYSCAPAGASWVGQLTLINMMTIAAALASLLLATTVFLRKPVQEVIRRYSTHIRPQPAPRPAPSPSPGPTPGRDQTRNVKTNIVLQGSGVPDIILDNYTMKLWQAGGLALGYSQEKSDIAINNNSVSRVHARLTCDTQSGLCIEDLGSLNKTKINGSAIQPRKSVSLRTGDRVELGEISYLVKKTGGNVDSNSHNGQSTAPGNSWRLSGFDSHGLLVQHNLKVPATMPPGQQMMEICTIGSSPQCDFAIVNDETVSRTHASIGYVPKEGLCIKDLGSTNGTHVDGQKIGEQYVYLGNAQKIVLGKTKLSLSKTSSGSWVMNEGVKPVPAVLNQEPARSNFQKPLPHSPQPPAAKMTSMWDYFIRCFTQKYTDFSGRATRRECWSFMLFYTIIFAVIAGIGAIGVAISGGSAPLIVWVLLIPLIFGSALPALAVLTRRLHDIGKSGWWILLQFIPLVGVIAIFVMAALPTQPFANQYGPNPHTNG